MSPARRCICPDCGASHARRRTSADTIKRSSMTDTTDLDLTKCPQCKTPTLAGRIEAQDRHLDTDPLNEIGVLAYHPTGRALCTITGGRGRNLPHTFTWPPNAETTIHVEHACGKTVPKELRENLTTRRPRIPEYPNTPPY